MVLSRDLVLCICIVVVFVYTFFSSHAPMSQQSIQIDLAGATRLIVAGITHQQKCSLSNVPDIVQTVLSTASFPQFWIIWQNTHDVIQPESAIQTVFDSSWQTLCDALAKNQLHFHRLTLFVQDSELCLHMLTVFMEALVTNHTVHFLKVSDMDRLARRYGSWKYVNRTEQIVRQLTSMLVQRKATLSLDLAYIDVAAWTHPSLDLQHMPCLHNGTLTIHTLPPAWAIEPVLPCTLAHVHVHRAEVGEADARRLELFFQTHHIRILSVFDANNSYFKAKNMLLRDGGGPKFDCSVLQALCYEFEDVHANSPFQWTPLLEAFVHQAPRLRWLLMPQALSVLAPLLQDASLWPNLEMLAVRMSNMDVDSNRPLLRILQTHTKLSHLVLDIWPLAPSEELAEMLADLLAQSAVRALTIIDREGLRMIEASVATILQHPQCRIEYLCVPQHVVDEWTLVHHVGHFPSVHHMYVNDRQTYNHLDVVYNICPQLFSMTKTKDDDATIATVLLYRKMSYIIRRDAWQQVALVWIWNQTLRQHTLRHALTPWLPILRRMTGGSRARPWELYMPDLTYAGVQPWDPLLTKTIANHDWPWLTAYDDRQFWNAHPLAVQTPCQTFYETEYGRQ